METINQVLESYKAASELLGRDNCVTSSLTGQIHKNLLFSVEEDSIDDT